MSSLLSDLHSSSRYSAFKTLLIDTFGISKDQWDRQFFAINELRDCMPSEIMDDMLKLHSSEMLNFLLCYCFKRLLPPLVRPALGSFRTKNLHEFACEADRLMCDVVECMPLVSLMSKTMPTLQQSSADSPSAEVSALSRPC